MPDAQLLAIRQLLASTPDYATTQPAKLQDALNAFVSLNEDVSRSPNYQSQELDDLDSVQQLLSSDAVRSHEELLLCVLKTLKILTRKYNNRVRLGEHIVEDLVKVLHLRLSPLVSGEASNVVLNICYERENVVRLVSAGGVPPLISFAKDDSQTDLQANAAGAVQSICFQKEGRTFVREHGAIEAVLPLLGSANLNVQTRAVGAVHNMSSEPEAIRVIRRLNGIPLLIQLLRVPSAPVCGSAAGALQATSLPLPYLHAPRPRRPRHSPHSLRPSRPSHPPFYARFALSPPPPALCTPALCTPRASESLPRVCVSGRDPPTGRSASALRPTLRLRRAVAGPRPSAPPHLRTAERLCTAETPAPLRRCTSAGLCGRRHPQPARAVARRRGSEQRQAAGLQEAPLARPHCGYAQRRAAGRSDPDGPHSLQTREDMTRPSVSSMGAYMHIHDTKGSL